MSDAAVKASAPVAATPAKTPKKKAAGASKAKKPADHPKYASMINDALNALKERGGSSRQAVLKYIVKNYHLGQDNKIINAHLKLALRAGLKNGSLKQSKGLGASGSFKIGTDKEPKAKKPKAKAAAKPKAKKPKTAGSPKKAAKPKAKKAAGEAKGKKPKAKKPKSPKKVAKPKAAKPKAAKKPKAAAAKPKKPKSPKAKKPKATGAAKPKKAAAKK